MTRKFFVLLLTAALLLSACNLPVASDVGTHAWIDAPLDGMVLPLQPYTIVFHASVPLGVTQMEIRINGQVLATLPNPDPTQRLVTLSQVWQPAQAGRYGIAVRAQDRAGNWTAPDNVTVKVLLLCGWLLGVMGTRKLVMISPPEKISVPLVAV